jgi:quinol-cytochrome oxidoreductase complex cytochrome b subunit
MSYAAVRPDAWNFPLFLHVLGATTLVGLLAVAVAVLLAAARADDDRTAAVRLAFRTLLIGAVPAYIVMRVGAEWIASKEDLTDSNASWIGIGYSVADASVLVLIVVNVLAGLAYRRARRGGQPLTLVRWTTGLTLLLIVAYAVALWAMATKPA